MNDIAITGARRGEITNPIGGLRMGGTSAPFTGDSL